MDAGQIARERGLPVVRVGKENSSRWGYSLTNIRGGSFGSNDRNLSRIRAIAKALRGGGVKAGDSFLILTERWNGRKWVHVSLVEAVLEVSGFGAVWTEGSEAA
jgi:hypothetical protein